MGKKHTKHRRRSRIETELPVEVREDVHRLLLDGTIYDDIEIFLKGKGYDISRSAIGRYGKDFFEVYREVLRFEEQATLLVSEAGDGMVLEEAVSKVALQRVMAALVDGSVNILEVPRLLSDVAKLQSSNLQREKWKEQYADKIRQEERKRLLEKTTNALENVADAETIKRVREQFL